MKVLIATDGSKYAQKATRKCCEYLPMNEDLTIKIISVAEPFSSIPTDPFGVSNEFFLERSQELVEIAEKLVEEAKKIIREVSEENVQIETDVIKGFPKEAIVDEAKNWEADLIVVGSHGYGFWERMLIGSVSAAVIHHAPCSVLVIKDDDDSEE